MPPRSTRSNDAGSKGPARKPLGIADFPAVSSSRAMGVGEQSFRQGEDPPLQVGEPLSPIEEIIFPQVREEGFSEFNKVMDIVEQVMWHSGIHRLLRGR